MRSSRPSARRRPSAFATDNGQRTTDKLGFTLIEVLVVIVILAILIALLMPVISSGATRAREAQVKTEIQQLETSLNSFRSNHSDVVPPSRLLLFEKGDATANGWFTTGANAAEAQRSRMIVGKIWPQFDFTLERDINGDGDTDDTLTLTGAECLVFFLGGMRNWDNSQTPHEGLEVIGFAKNPANPFSRTDNNRFTPDFEFDTGRLVDVDGDQVSEYLDPLSGQTAPYLYVSGSYGGYSLNAAQRAAGTDDLDVFPNGQTNNRNMKDIYRQGSAAASPAWNGKSFQLLSAGMDFEYGQGGEYDPARAASLLKTSARIAEQDNLTNFHGGRLQP